jgi:hypothetical protein
MIPVHRLGFCGCVLVTSTWVIVQIFGSVFTFLKSINIKWIDGTHTQARNTLDDPAMSLRTGPMQYTNFAFVAMKQVQKGGY